MLRWGLSVPITLLQCPFSLSRLIHCMSGWWYIWLVYSTGIFYSTFRASTWKPFDRRLFSSRVEVLQLRVELFWCGSRILKGQILDSRRPPPSVGTAGRPGWPGGQTHTRRVGQAAWMHRQILNLYLYEKKLFWLIGEDFKDDLRSFGRLNCEIGKLKYCIENFFVPLTVWLTHF